MLTYPGTATPVALGDHVLYRGLLSFSAQAGKVWYLPGQSPPHPEMVASGVEHWAILLEDGTMLAWAYLPDQVEVVSGLQFARRADTGFVGLQPTDPTGMGPDHAFPEEDD